VHKDPAATLDQLFAHVQPAHEMVRHPDIGQPQHQIFADTVVQHALACNDALLGAIARRRVILEILNERARLRPFEQDLGFAFVELPAPGHGLSLHERAASRAKMRSGTAASACYSSHGSPAKRVGQRRLP
jgi:hypothetical protein